MICNIYKKNRIQERTNITKIVKITYYNRINDHLVKLCPVVKVARSFRVDYCLCEIFSVFELRILERKKNTKRFEGMMIYGDPCIDHARNMQIEIQIRIVLR
jgi:hypothetical protein